MNKKLQNQIKAYAGIAGAILGSEKLNGQVVITDYTPPITLTVTPPSDMDSIYIDVDNNGADDFKFKMFICLPCSSCWYNDIVVNDPGMINSLKMDLVMKHAFASGSVSYLTGPVRLSCGDLIDNTGTWQIPIPINVNNFLRRDFSCSGSQTTGLFNMDWGGWPVSGSLGVKFNISGVYHFGWIKLQLSHYQIEIFQSGYQLQPDVPVITCDTTNLATGISENNLQLNFSQQNNSIHISTLQNLNHANICVYDLLGKEVFQQPFEGKEATFTIDKKGIYFVEVKSEKGVSRKKIFIY